MLAPRLAIVAALAAASCHGAAPAPASAETRDRSTPADAAADTTPVRIISIQRPPSDPRNRIETFAVGTNTRDVVVIDGNVYFTANDGIRVAPVAGHVAPTLVVPMGGVGELVAGLGRLYFIAYVEKGSAHGFWPFASTPSNPVSFQGWRNDDTAGSLTVAGDAVYWLNNMQELVIAAAVPGSKPCRVKIDGAGVGTLAVASGVAYMGPATDAVGLVAGPIRSRPANCNPTERTGVVVPTEDYVRALPADADQLLWATNQELRAMRLPRHTGDLGFRIANITGTDALTLTREAVYWVEGTGCTPGGCSRGAVRRAARDGTGVEDLAVDQGAPSGVAVDHDTVYWTVQDGGEVRRRTLRTPRP